jgi:uncharacterized membrane protein
VFRRVRVRACARAALGLYAILVFPSFFFCVVICAVTVSLIAT